MVPARMGEGGGSGDPNRRLQGKMNVFKKSSAEKKGSTCCILAYNSSR